MPIHGQMPIDRSFPSQYHNLSLKARGLLSLLATMSMDESPTDIRIRELCTDGKHAVSNAFRELEEAGYITRTQVRGKGGGPFGAMQIVINNRIDCPF